MILPVTSPIIDAHTHIFPPEIAADRRRVAERDAWFASLYASPRAALATAEDLIAALDAAGVEAAVALAFGWRDAGIGRLHNAYLLDAARRYPGRIIPFAYVAPDTSDPDLAGFAGIGEWMPEGQGFDLDDHRRLAGQLLAARHVGVPILTHVSEPVGHAYPGKSNVAPERLWRLARAFPANRFIAAHWGGGLLFYELMPEVRQDLVNVSYDTAAGRLLYDRAIFDVALRILGPGKILWGSDYPILSIRRYLRAVRRLGVDDAVLTRLLGGNLSALLERNVGIGAG